MNCEQLQELQDIYRDGDLIGPQAAELEQHLADCPGCEAMWRRESAWMAVLGEKTPVNHGRDAAAFTAQAVRRWSKAHEPSILARIGRYSAAAAIVLLLLSVAAVIVTTDVVRPHPITGLVTRADGPSHPISVLLAETRRSMHAPRRAINQTASYMDVTRFADMLPAPRSASGFFLDDSR